jgi:hypothetical protein
LSSVKEIFVEVIKKGERSWIPAGVYPERSVRAGMT